MYLVTLAVIGFVVGPVVVALVASVPDRSGGGTTALACPTCGDAHGLGFLLPVVGRPCQACGQQPSTLQRVTPLLTAAVFVIVGQRVGATPVVIPILVGATALLALSLVDIERYRLPDRLLFPSLAAVALLVAVVSIWQGHIDNMIVAFITAIVYFVALLIPNLISPAGLAFGDVKLALLLGLMVGWMRSSISEGIVLMIYALLLGMILGVASGLAVGVGRRVFGPGFLPDPDVPEDERDEIVPITRTAFPFGPALALSALVVMFASNAILVTPGLIGS